MRARVMPQRANRGEAGPGKTRRGGRAHRAAARRDRMGERRWLVVMLRIPVAGRVKTRLARDIGIVAATSFYRHAAAALVARLARPRDWTTVLAVTPDCGVTHPSFPQAAHRMTQGRGDLGARLQRIMDTLPPGPVIVIGSDVPGIAASHIARAFHLLAGAEAAIGPSPDGGYWLIGLRRRPRRLAPFGAVRWSSRHAREDTLRNLDRARIAWLPELDDIDEAADLARHRRHLGRRLACRT